MRLFFLLLAISTLAYSQDFTTTGLKELDRKVIGNSVNIVLEDGNKRVIEVVYKDELSKKELSLVKNIYKTLITWEELELKKAEIIFTDESTDIIILPESLIYNGVDLSKYMPSGMQFYYTNFFEYDFRMFKDTLFMRLKGHYYSKEEFFNEIYSAYLDPILYIQIHDPSYLIRQIDKLREVNSNQNAQISELITSLNNLSQKHEELLEEHRKLRDGTVAINNKSFFGSLGPFSHSDIEEAIIIKKENPKYSTKEVASKLKDKGLKVSIKTIDAVFMIYFGEFPQNK